MRLQPDGVSDMIASLLPIWLGFALPAISAPSGQAPASPAPAAPTSKSLEEVQEYFERGDAVVVYEVGFVVDNRIEAGQPATADQAPGSRCFVANSEKPLTIAASILVPQHQRATRLVLVVSGPSTITPLSSVDLPLEPTIFPALYSIDVPASSGASWCVSLQHECAGRLTSLTSAQLGKPVQCSPPSP